MLTLNGTKTDKGTIYLLEHNIVGLRTLDIAPDTVDILVSGSGGVHVSIEHLEELLLVIERNGERNDL